MRKFAENTRAGSQQPLTKNFSLFTQICTTVEKICRNTIKLIKIRDAFLIIFSFPPSLLKIRRCKSKNGENEIYVDGHTTSFIEIR